MNEANEVTASIDAKLGKMRENWLKGMSPHVRALYRAYQQAERDHRAGRELAEALPLLPGVGWPEYARGIDGMDEAEWEELDELEERGITPQ